MDENGVAGSIQEVKGASKEATGNALGHACLESDREAERSSAREIMLAA